MINYEKILNWIDEDMKFDKWYNVKSDEQVEAIKDLMRAGFLPDCVFNDEFSKFKKVTAYYEYHFQ
jgi:hypothetical protein